MRRRNGVAPAWPFLGTEAVAAGTVNRYQLSTRFYPVYRNVYVPRGTKLTPVDKAVAAWLWSGRRATVAGVSAAALHGSLWIDAGLPAELNQPSRHQTSGILLHSDELWADESCLVRGIRATTISRTAFDLGRRPDLTMAVIRLDALMNATVLKVTDVQMHVDRHRGARGLAQLRQALDLADGGAESPQETRLRLLLTSVGMRPHQTQIEVFDRYGGLVGRIDMGWPTWRVGVEYDGIQHWTDPARRTRDIDRAAALDRLGWRIVRVGADLLRYRQGTVVARTREALQAAGARY